MSSSISSHIQIPKCVLKQFEDEAGFLYYYDFSSGRIKKGHAKSVNTEKDYYSKDIELFLNRQVESGMGKLIKQLNDSIEGQKPICLLKNSEDVVYNYLWALLSRSPNALSEMKKSSVYAQFMSERNQHDAMVLYGLDIAREQNYFGDYFITLMGNDTDVPFVLPLIGAYSYGNGYINIFN